MYNIITIRNKLIESGKRKEKHMEDMGMTDKQFNGFLRMLLDRLEEVKNEDDEEEKSERLKKLIEDLQKTLED